ncbi:beta-lactamase family protein [Aureibaculum sp. A20]|uniref:Beta-lactamase family protein n=1 Tax=Aureibaculum flavum TaxID=2795986 RepID=A0ABS0WPW3_9FLAO|nr:serine hydrolase domain-containing protein [Aureibaculum flavum]MBJ2174020.1 beta-lactamase family protein [Aureibaculum flavum]
MIRFVLIIALLFCSYLQSQTGDKTKLDSLFSNIEENKIGMGTVSIFKDGKEVYQKSIGFSNINSKSKANALTKYRIGSITKTFTATIIMQLIDEEKLNLNSNLSTYFPEIENAEIITIENLLYHRSGLHNVTNEKDFQLWISKPRTRNEMLEKFIKNGVDFEPNEKTAYSNTNYILLSYIAEDIDNKSFSEILDTRISKPIKLNKTIYGKDIIPSENEAVSYYQENSAWKPITLETDLAGPMGAGAIVSTPRELNVFYDNLFSGKLVSRVALEQMKSVKENMGMGLSKLVFKGLEVYGHDGGIDGFRSMAAYIPSKNVSIAFSFNAASTSTTPILIAILETYFSDDPSLENTSKIVLKSEDLEVYLGVYSGSTFPAKVTFTKEGNTLFAQATGQPIFKLIAIDKDSFSYDSMGIKFTFNLANNSMILNFGGKIHDLQKE